MKRPFRDRADAGRQLAVQLASYVRRTDVVVLGLVRGGMPVALEVARTLRAPLAVFAVRKLGVPGHEELAMGAIASGGPAVINRNVVVQLGIDKATLQSVEAQGRKELRRREELYGQAITPSALQGRTVILVDDGLATGTSMKAAVQAVKAQRPARLVVAVPVSSVESYAAFKREVDDMVCLFAPSDFYAVGNYYENFTQMTDADVAEALDRARQELPPLPQEPLRSEV